MNFLRKNWLLILTGLLTILLAILAVLTAVRLKTIAPVAPTVPQRQPRAVAPACTLTFDLLLSPTPTAAPSGTPAPSATPTPTTGVSIPTVTQTPAPTQKPNELPNCTGLSASPTSGTVPLTVSFTGNGTDRDGKIISFEFTFGDGAKETKEIERVYAKDNESVTVAHTYDKAGSYWASLRVRDNNDEWSGTPDACRVKIEVEAKIGGGPTSTPRPTEKPGVTRTPTPIPTGTPRLTATPALLPGTTATPSATIYTPPVPQAGFDLPTVGAVVGGLLLTTLGLLLIL